MVLSGAARKFGRVVARGALGATAALLVASPATAATYTAATAGELSTHLASAEASTDADTINIVAGTIALPGQLTYAGSSSLVLAGAGRGATTLTISTAGAATSAIAATGSGVVEVRDLRIERTGTVPSESAVLQVTAPGSSIRRVDLIGIGDSSNSWAAIASGTGTIITDSTVDVDSGNGIAVRAGAVADHVSLTGSATAGVGVQLQDSSDLTFARIFDFGVGVDAIATVDSPATADGNFLITDSVIDIGAAAGPIVRAATSAGSRTAMAEVFRIRRSTMVGTGNGIIGLYGNARVAGDTLNLSMDRSILYVPGSTDPWECPVSSGTEYINLHGTLKAAIPIANTGQFCDSQGYGGNSEATPKFVDLAGRDYRLRWDAVEVDATFDDTANALDLAGNPRVVDGNGDASARIDLGAWEYQPTPPSIASLVATPTTIEWGQSVSLSVSASDPDGQLPLTYAWKRSINSFQDTVSGGPTHSMTFGAYGTWTIQVTVRDATNAPVTATTTVRVLAPTTTTTTGTTGTTGTTDRTAPSVSTLAAPTRRLRRDRLPIRRLRSGGTAANAVRIAVSEASALVIQVTTSTGRRIGTAQTVTGLPRGTSYIAWGGRVGTQQLRAGCYVWQVRARDAARNLSVRRNVRVCLA